MKVSKLLVSICAIAAFSCAFAENNVVAKYNGKDLTKSEVEKIIRIVLNGKLPQDKKNFDDLDPNIKAQIISEVVHQKVLDDAVSTSSIAAQQSYKDQLDLLQKNIAINLYLDRVVQGAVTPSMIRTEYSDYVTLMKGNDEIKVSHILVENEKEANEVYDLIVKKKTMSFEDAAKKYSVDSSKNTGGLIGVISKGQMVPEFEKAAYSMKQGEVSKPVQTTFGWHIIKVDERKPRQIPTFDEIKPQMEQAASMKVRQTTVADLLKKAKVEIVPIAATK